MAPRAFWTGHLRLSLVNIPVKLYPATSSERRIELHQIHEPSGKRIRYQKVAPGVGPVENEEITKGYEYEKGKYVLIDPKEIDELKLASKADHRAGPLRRRGRHRPALLRDALLSASRRRSRRRGLHHPAKGAEGHRQDRRRPVHPARPRQHRRHQAIRQGTAAGSAAPRQRSPRGRADLQGNPRGEGRQGSARSCQGADQAQSRQVRSRAVQGRI